MTTRPRHLRAVPEHETDAGVVDDGPDLDQREVTTTGVEDRAECTRETPIAKAWRAALAVLSFTEDEAFSIASISFRADSIWIYATQEIPRLGKPIARHGNGTHVHRIALPERNPE